MGVCRGNEKSAIADALAEMQRTNGHAYKHAGVELARMPGGEKLRVRLTKDNGDANDADFSAGEDRLDPDSIDETAAEEGAEA